MKTALSTRQQDLLQRAASERAAWPRTVAPLRQPLLWVDKVLPWLIGGFKLARGWKRRKT
jgi:hypothetical protein